MHLQVLYLNKCWEGARLQFQIEKGGHPGLWKEVIAEPVIVHVEEEGRVAWYLDID